jgi:N-methylhydantoinase B/oxoprolinase/acetone carboxylase alpha subunit
MLFEDRFDRAELAEGDVFVTNDPWLGGGHLLDVVVVSPVFFDGELVGFAGTLGHVNDIGGRSGAFTADAAQVYEEGLLIPPVKLFESGEKNQAVEDMIRANVRLPDQIVGDIEAMWSVNNIGASALCDIIDTYGLESYQQATDDILARSERALRAEISEIEDGKYESEYSFSIPEVETNDGRLRIEVTVTVDGGDIHVDFSGTSNQVPAGVNVPFTNIQSVTEYIIRCMTVPDIRGSSGLSEPITITAPSGTIVNPDRPAATEARHLTYYPAEYCLVKALGEALPEQLVTDFTAGFQVFSASGKTEAGEEFIGVGMGCQTAPARATGDPPKNIMHFPGNAKIVSVEMIEQYVPILW